MSTKPRDGGAYNNRLPAHVEAAVQQQAGKCQTPEGCGQHGCHGACLPEPDVADLWAEIFRLRAALQGPDGYATWKEAAMAERLRRVNAEMALSWIATDDEQPPVGERVFWLDAHHNMVGYDTYLGEPYRFDATHWMRIPPVPDKDNTSPMQPHSHGLL